MLWTAFYCRISLYASVPHKTYNILLIILRFTMLLSFETAWERKDEEAEKKTTDFFVAIFYGSNRVKNSGKCSRDTLHCKWFNNLSFRLFQANSAREKPSEPLEKGGTNCHRPPKTLDQRCFDIGTIFKITMVELRFTDSELFSLVLAQTLALIPKGWLWTRRVSKM